MILEQSLCGGAVDAAKLERVESPPPRVLEEQLGGVDYERGVRRRSGGVQSALSARRPSTSLASPSTSAT